MSDQDATFRWEDPPPVTFSRKRRSVWDARLKPLRDHPGKWARLGLFHTSTAAQLRAGRIGDARPGEFQVTMRNIQDNTKGDLYARCVSADGDSPDTPSDLGA